jgi:hypothetical protein
LFVAAEQVQLPDIPYFAVSETEALPPDLLTEAAALTQCGMKSLPFFRGSLHRIFFQLHQLGLVYARATTIPSIDRYVTTMLYDTEYALIEVLSAQKQTEKAFSHTEILIAETLQLYLWVGPRRLQPQTRLCSLLASRVASAILPFISGLRASDKARTTNAESLQGPLSNRMDNVSDLRYRPYSIDSLIMWSLALSTVVGAATQISRHLWLEEHFALQIQLMSLHDDIDAFRGLLALFPKVDGFPWISLEDLYNRMCSMKKK